MLEYDVDENIKSPDSPFMIFGNSFYYDDDGYLCYQVDSNTLLKYKPDDFIIKTNELIAPYQNDIDDFDNAIRVLGTKEVIRSFTISCECEKSKGNHGVEFYVHVYSDGFKMVEWNNVYYYQCKDNKYSFFYNDQLYESENDNFNDVLFALAAGHEIDIEYHKEILVVFKDFIESYNYHYN